jgi:hypothetical protein
MKNKTVALVLVLAALPLVACTKKTSSSSSNTDTGSASASDTSTGPVADARANGVYNYAATSYAEKAKIIGAEEGYILDNFLAGVPLYDDGSAVIYNPRLSGILDKYIPNYGFGVGRATITKPMDDTAEPVAAYKNYFHAFEAADPATYNAMNATDSVSSDVNSYFTMSYYEQKPNATADGYVWYPALATEKPVAVNADEKTGMATTWKIKVHVDDDKYVYNTLSAKPSLKAFAGTKIKLEDYLTPYKLCLNNGWSRATDLASASYGFAGVQEYSDAISAGKTGDWSKVGIQTDATDNSLVFTFNSPKNQFYAMYYVSNGMYAPLPAEFITALDAFKTGTQTGASLYGIYNDTGAGASGLTGVDSVLSVGVYMPELVSAGSQITFKKNPTCCVASDYHFEGYKEWIWTAAATTSGYGYDQYKAYGNLDAVGIPAKHLKDEASNPNRKQTLGSTVWKFQTNTCTQALWNKLFGTNGTINQGTDNSYVCKPIMANKNFLNGLYFAVNRTELAAYLGSAPSQAFFSDAYDYDPENGLSYRSSDAGKAVLANRSPDTLGYSAAAAQTLFATAIEQEQAKGNYIGGTASDPVVITLNNWYQSAGQITNEGGMEAKYFEDSFNAACLTKYGVKLVINNQAGAVWSDVYHKHLMVGDFDLGFGAISGNTLDPLSFCDTVCSDNRSGFTLCWGQDTSVCEYDEATGVGSIMYDGKAWSYDALFEAGTAGTVVTEGVSTPVCAFYADETSDDSQVIVPVAALGTGTADVTVRLSYYVDTQVSIKVTRIAWYNPNTKKEDMTFDLASAVDDDNGTITVTAKDVDLTMAETYGSGIIEGYDVSVGYLSVYFTQTVAGVSTPNKELDATVIFAAKSASTSSSSIVEAI